MGWGLREASGTYPANIDPSTPPGLQSLVAYSVPDTTLVQIKMASGISVLQIQLRHPKKPTIENFKQKILNRRPVTLTM